MHSLDIRGRLLYLKGKSHTLAMTEAHNAREIPIELYAADRIDPSKIHLNHELVSLREQSLEDTVKQVILNAGMDITKGTFKRSDKGYAIEWLFTVTPGFQCDYKALYADTLAWLKELLPKCPIAYAVIHFDEADPHLHVIMVPVDGKGLPASKILGYKGCSRERSRDLYEKVGRRYGLSFPLTLTGATKKKACELVIKACEKLGYPKNLGKVWEAMKTAIHARPEPWLWALGIQADKLGLNNM